MVSMKARLTRLFAKSKVNQILITNTSKKDPNFVYLTGFSDGVFEGSVLLVNKSSMTLFVDPLDYGTAKRERPREMKIVLLNKSGMLRKALKKSIGGKTVGINGSFMPYNTYRTLSSRVKVKLVDASEQLLSARLVKDELELSNMRKAVSLTKKALSAGKSALRVGMSETDAAAAIDAAMLKMGSAPAFTSIVAFDANSAIPHHTPGNSRLRPNSIVLFDIGAGYKGYCGDMSRTFMFMPNKKSGKYKRFQEMYDTVITAQRLALKKIKEGSPAKSSHLEAENYINTHRGGIYKGKFVHALGHSIGVEVHDGSVGLYPNCSAKLERNMIFSDEPGIYIEGFGGVRIEDDVLVGKGSSSFI